MYLFTTYVATWLTYIRVESSTGTITSVTGVSNVTRTCAVLLVTTREPPIGCTKGTQYNTLDPMISVREIIKVNV